MTTAYNGPGFQGPSTLLETWCVSTRHPGGLWPPITGPVYSPDYECDLENDSLAAQATATPQVAAKAGL